MNFEWDEQKNRINVEKHGIDFKAAAGVFYSDYVVKRFSFVSEERWLATGIVKEARITVIYTIRNGIYRIISARKAKKNE